jgi:hypothetical protein
MEEIVSVEGIDNFERDQNVGVIADQAAASNNLAVDPQLEEVIAFIDSRHLQRLAQVEGRLAERLRALDELSILASHSEQAVSASLAPMVEPVLLAPPVHGETAGHAPLALAPVREAAAAALQLQSLVQRVTQIGQFAQHFADELGDLLGGYQAEQGAIVAELQQQQTQHQQLEQHYLKVVQQYKKMQQELTAEQQAKAQLAASLQALQEQQQEWQRSLQAAKVAKEQAEQRASIAIEKARSYAEERQKAVLGQQAAEAQAQKAVMQAREAMSYFFSKTVDSSLV